MDSNTYVEPSKITLGEYARQWLQRRKATGKGLKATTAANYRRYVEQDIIPSKLGKMLLTDIRRHPHINLFVADLTAAGRGAVTVRRILARLSTVFASAVKDGLISGNPVVGADRPVREEPVRVWEPEHVREFLQRSARHRLGPLFEMAVLTGLRRGEITGCAGPMLTCRPQDRRKAQPGHR